MNTPNDTKFTKTNKSGYEIRSDILAMAKDYVERSYVEEVQRLTLLHGIDMETGKLQEGTLPQMYTINDILDIAEQLYLFVSQNSKPR